MYEFAADRQFIFSVEVDGRTRLVTFGERNQFGTSLFQTEDGKVAESIRKTGLFRRGVIKETHLQATTHPVPPEGRETDSGTSAGTGAEAVVKVETKMFANFTQAREWLSKTYGLAKGSLRTPAAVQKAAEEHGIQIGYEQR